MITSSTLSFILAYSIISSSWPLFKHFFALLFLSTFAITSAASFVANPIITSRDFAAALVLPFG
jgi:hypothetical protein